MTNYHVQLMDGTSETILADKFLCEVGYTVFYVRDPATKTHDEVARYKSSTIKSLKEE